MPLVKRLDGWHWGSKGPFPTKAQALSVARAAYAHGYKEQCQPIRETTNAQTLDVKSQDRA
jgi:hypothetical protein